MTLRDLLHLVEAAHVDDGLTVVVVDDEGHEWPIVRTEDNGTALRLVIRPGSTPSLHSPGLREPRQGR